MFHAKFIRGITINSMAILGTIIGFTHFLPFLDIPVLDGIELTLISALLVIYGIKRNIEEKK